jgi:hypothetical protein
MSVDPVAPPCRRRPPQPRGTPRHASICVGAVDFQQAAATHVCLNVPSFLGFLSLISSFSFSHRCSVAGDGRVANVLGGDESGATDEDGDAAAPPELDLRVGFFPRLSVLPARSESTFYSLPTPDLQRQGILSNGDFIPVLKLR